MAKTVLIDSGPIVAAIRKRDQHHSWSRAQFESCTEPFVTCEAVISESHFLLQGISGGIEALYGFLQRGVIVVDFSLEDELTETVRLIRRYRDIPISMADACLVRMAELAAAGIVFTIDSDFRIYRKNGRRVIPLLIPA